MPRVLKAIAVLSAMSFALAACGSDGESTTAAPPDPGRDVMQALVDAAAADDAESAWELLSMPSRERAGPTLEEFEENEFPELKRTLAPFAEDPLPVEVSENLDGEFGVVALSRGNDAFATPLRREGEHWRVELASPVTIDVLGPPPGSRGEFAKQIGVEKRGAGGAGLAVLYLDGVTLDAETFADADSATIFANFESKLEPGRHTAVAFTGAAGEAAARAWTFVP
jgi:predicted small lipoprotein YifL